MSITARSPALTPTLRRRAALRTSVGPRPWPTRLSTVISASVALLMLVSACGSESEKGASSSPAVPTGGCARETSDTRLAAVTPIPIPPAQVTVLDPGTGPGRIPTVSPDVSTAQNVQLITTSTADQSGSGSTSQTLRTPLTARFACTDPTDLAVVIGNPTTPQAELADQLRAAAGSQAGIRMGEGEVPESIRLLPTDATSAPARRALEQSVLQALQNSIALPTTAVAVGATWRTERTIAAAATVVQTVNARLTRWDGNRITISFTADESPVNSIFTIPDSSTSLTIARYTYTGTGEVTLDLTRGLPVAGHADYSGLRELVGADPQQPLLQRLGFALRWQ